MSFEVDSTNYIPLPRLGAASATALTTSLASAMPSSMPKGVKDAAKKMVAAKDALLLSWQDEPVQTVDDRRPADVALDRAWAALHARLKAFSNLPEERHPEAAKAAELLRLLFPDGLRFLQLPYNTEWAESEKRLKLIGRQGLVDAFKDFGDMRFLDEVQQAHAVYGKVLGITTASAGEQPRVRVENLRKLRIAMRRYVFSVLALVEDEATATLVRSALKPMDDLRANINGRAAGSTELEDSEGVDSVQEKEAESSASSVDEAPVTAPAAPSPARPSPGRADPAAITDAAMDAEADKPSVDCQ